MSIFADEAPEQVATPTRVRLRQVAALVVIGLAVLMAFWGTPTTASPAEFGDALHRGAVASMEINPTARLGLDAEPQVRFTGSSPSAQAQVVWLDNGGWLHTTDLRDLVVLPDPATVPDPNDPEAFFPTAPQGITVDLPATLAATAGDSTGVAATDTIGAAAWRGAPLIALQVIAVIVMISSRQPRRMTKWAWFWILALPLGIGMGWWVLREIPWDSRTALLDEPRPRERGVLADGRLRWGGGRAWLVGFGVSLAVGLLLIPLLHIRLVPLPTPPELVTYQVVWSPTSHGTWVVGS